MMSVRVPPLNELLMSGNQLQQLCEIQFRHKMARRRTLRIFKLVLALLATVAAMILWRHFTKPHPEIINDNVFKLRPNWDKKLPFEVQQEPQNDGINKVVESINANGYKLHESLSNEYNPELFINDKSKAKEIEDEFRPFLHDVDKSRQFNNGDEDVFANLPMNDEDDDIIDEEDDDLMADADDDDNVNVNRPMKSDLNKFKPINEPAERRPIHGDDVEMLLKDLTERRPIHGDDVEMPPDVETDEHIDMQKPGVRPNDDGHTLPKNRDNQLPKNREPSAEKVVSIKKQGFIPAVRSQNTIVPFPKVVGKQNDLIEITLPKGHNSYHYYGAAGERHNGKPFLAMPDKEMMHKHALKENTGFEHDRIPVSFITAARKNTFYKVLYLINSLQRYVPETTLYVFNLDLLDSQLDYLKTLCRVEVKQFYKEFMHIHMQDLDNNFWRPVILQLALSEFHNILWLDPNWMLASERILKLLAAPVNPQVTVIGKEEAYSTFAVTNPGMYEYLPTDEYQLKYTPHLQVHALLLHKTIGVMDMFMKWWFQCSREEYCQAPVGSRHQCSPGAGKTTEYRNCHRYDESSLNVLLKNWYHHDISRFSVRDDYFLSTPDVTRYPELRKCNLRDREL